MRLASLCGRCLNRETCKRNKSSVNNSCNRFEIDVDAAKDQAVKINKVRKVFEPMVSILEDCGSRDYE